MQLYKLTDENGFTQRRTYWELGETHEVGGIPRLCSSTVLHAYPSPLLAALMNPAHCNFKYPKCFVVEGEVCITDGTKGGSQKLTVVGTFELPKVTQTQYIAFGILCALEVYHDNKFVLWTANWLNNTDRTSAAAAAASSAASSAAADYAASAAADAYTYSAAAAADDYAYSAAASTAAYSAAAVASAASDDAYSVASAAAAASSAASSAAGLKQKIDFQAIAEKALTF
jgi:hypothetical protein